MEIILLEKIANLGSLGDKVTVKNGYARNYLIPQRKAVVASAKKIAEFEVRRTELEKAANEKLLAAQSRAEVLGKLQIVIAHKAGDEGRLFGSIGTHAIADAIAKAGVAVDKSEIRLPHGTIRHLGDFEVHVHLHADVNAVCAVKITAEA
ncbi:MAG: 50S ribosomal protein L9 [Methylococcaceae bacterium]